MMLRSYRAGAGRWLEATAISLVVHGGTAAALFAAAGFIGQDPAPPPKNATTITVTIQTPSNDDLRRLKAVGEGESEIITGEGPVETLTPLDDSEALEQIAGEETELAILAPVLPETGAALETVTPDDAGILTALPPISPIAPPENIPITLAPVLPKIPSTGQNDTQQVLQTLQPQVDPTPEAAPTGGAVSAAPPDPDLADLISRFRVQLSEPCTVGIPQRSGTGALAVTLFGQDDAALDRFVEGALEGASFEVPLERRVLVDERQCPALNYIRQNRDYPASRIALQLDNQTISSGESLTGLVRTGSSEQVTVLLVDDNGVVQNLRRFMSFGVGGRARFDVPISRNGDNRPTQQLIVAISARSSVEPFEDRSGQTARETFDQLPSGLAERAAIAVQAFDIR